METTHVTYMSELCAWMLVAIDFLLIWLYAMSRQKAADFISKRTMKIVAFYTAGAIMTFGATWILNHYDPNLLIGRGMHFVACILLFASSFKIIDGD